MASSCWIWPVRRLACHMPGWPRAGGTVLLVGHQPTLGRVAARLLFDLDSDWSLKKGAIVWVSGRTDGARGCVLRAALTPDLL
jgi:phosphohistidine phosphatase